MKTLRFSEWLIIVLIGIIMLSVSLVSLVNRKKIEKALLESAKFEQGQKTTNQ